MRRSKALLWGLAMAVALGMYQGAQAGEITDALHANASTDNDELIDDDNEFILREVGSEGEFFDGRFDKVTDEIQEGDIFGGVIDILRIRNNAVDDQLNTVELTGVFVTQVSGIDEDDNAVGFAEFDFAAVSDQTIWDDLLGVRPDSFLTDATEIDQTVALFFEDGDPNDFSMLETDASGATEEAKWIDRRATATNGTQRMAVGFGEDDDFFISRAPRDAGAAAGGSFGDNFGRFLLGLSIFDFGFGDFIPNAIESQTFLFPDESNPNTINSELTHDITGDGELSVSDDGIINFLPFASQATLNIRAIPVPGTLGMLGLALIGLGAAARWRHRE